MWRLFHVVSSKEESGGEFEKPCEWYEVFKDLGRSNIVWMCDEYTRINDYVASMCDILECHNVEGHYNELLVYILATK